MYCKHRCFIRKYKKFFMLGVRSILSILCWYQSSGTDIKLVGQVYLFAFRAGDTRWNCFTQHVYTLRSLRLVSQINSSYIKSEQYTHTYIPHNLTQYWHSKQDLCSLYYYRIRHLHANWHVTRGWQTARAFEGIRLHRVIPTADGSALYWADSSGNHTGY